MSLTLRSDNQWWYGCEGQRPAFNYLRCLARAQQGAGNGEHVLDGFDQFALHAVRDGVGAHDGEVNAAGVEFADRRLGRQAVDFKAERRVASVPSGPASPAGSRTTWCGPFPRIAGR